MVSLIGIPVYRRYDILQDRYSNRIVFPVRADSRAAVRISVTIILLSSDDSPDGLIFPRTTAAR
jgi:hypothetical protein